MFDGDLVKTGGVAVGMLAFFGVFWLIVARISEGLDKVLRYVATVIFVFLAVVFMTLVTAGVTSALGYGPWHQSAKHSDVIPTGQIFERLESEGALRRSNALSDLAKFARDSVNVHSELIEKLPSALRVWRPESKKIPDAFGPRVEGCGRASDPLNCLDQISVEAMTTFKEAKPDVKKALAVLSTRNRKFDQMLVGNQSPSPVSQRSVTADEFGALTRQQIEDYFRTGGAQAANIPRPAAIVGEPVTAAIRLDLSGIDLGGLNENPTLQLECTNFKGSCLRACIMRGNDFRECEFEGADLSHSFLDGTRFQNANGMGANMILVAMCESNLSGAWLAGADLRGSNFYKADLSGACFLLADLRFFTIMRFCKANSTSFWGANLEKAGIARDRIYRQLRSTGGESQSLEAEFERLVFGPGPAKAEADFRKSDLRYASMKDVYWWGVDLRGADLRFARNLTEHQLKYAIISDDTHLPTSISANFASSLRGRFRGREVIHLEGPEATKSN